MTGSEVRSVAAADLNADGKLDLIVGSGGSANISILLGAGNGTFTAPLPYPVAGSPWSVVTGDFNGDVPAKSLSAGASPRHIVVGDFNLDGKPDLAVANGDFTIASKNYVSVLLDICPPPQQRRHSVRH